ncbi:MAG: CPBP family intramembrane metalloprotease [Candidatus Hydrogenedentes bacterium]|nr:CPBP family intramembrane metalloprotease [Candidatus Hydrogenedentota bacterium]
MLGVIFIGLMLAHVVYSLTTSDQPDGEPLPPRVRMVHLVLQAPLFWLAVYFAYEQGVLSRDLVSPFYIGIGLVAGHLVFSISLLATHLSFRDSWTHVFDFGPIWNFTMDSPIVLTRFIGVALAEELIWRVGTQVILIEWFQKWMDPAWGTALGIVAAATCFVLVHKHFFKNSWHVSVEFSVFALLLGVLYYWTNSFILVMVIHAMRDIEIAYLEYLIKVEELGDEKAAADAIERSYMPMRPEKS